MKIFESGHDPWKWQLQQQHGLRFVSVCSSVGSTKAETTTTPTQNHVCCTRPSLENLAGIVLTSSSSSSSSPASTSIMDSEVVFRRKKPHSSTENLDISSAGRVLAASKEYPQSADLLERNRRSRSEER